MRMLLNLTLHEDAYASHVTVAELQYVPRSRHACSPQSFLCSSGSLKMAIKDDCEHLPQTS